jgi:hypothetical protein
VSQSKESFLAALRAVGVGHDLGSTTGVAAPGTDWVVTPTVAGEPNDPGLILVNPGNAAASVTLHVLPAEGQDPVADVTVSIKPGFAAAAPSDFIDAAAFSAIRVVATSGVVVPIGASSSLGASGRSTYALSIGLLAADGGVPN